MKNIEKTLNVYNQVYNLKNLERGGWVKRNIEGRRESVAEHCFAMSTFAILINLEFNLNLDMEKVLTLINIHEYGEVKVGDLTPICNVSVSDKYKMELEGLEDILTDYPKKEMIINLWKEFENAETREAIFVSLLDKLQAVLQAKEYSLVHNRPELFEEFNNSFIKNIANRDQEKIKEFKGILF